MADISNIESAWLRATAKFNTWKVDFDAKFNAPVTKTITGMAVNKFNNLPPDVQTVSRTMSPDGWNVVDQINKQKKKKGINYANK